MEKSTDVDNATEALVDYIEELIQFSNKSLTFKVLGVKFGKSVENFIESNELTVNKTLLDQYLSVLNATISEGEVEDLAETLWQFYVEGLEPEDIDTDISGIQWVLYAVLHFIFDTYEKNPSALNETEPLGKYFNPTGCPESSGLFRCGFAKIADGSLTIYLMNLGQYIFKSTMDTWNELIKTSNLTATEN